MHLLIDRSSRHQSDKIDITICNFWKKAKSVFLALASAWTCQCQQHGANLLLQHRITSKAEFDITLTGFISSIYECHRVRISEGKDNVLNESISLLDSVPSRQPNHKQRRPTKSALRIKSAIKTLIGSSKSVDPFETRGSLYVYILTNFPELKRQLHLCTRKRNPLSLHTIK